MAHLTYNEKTESGTTEQHLNAISGSGGDHLVIVQQTADYSNKELIVTPSEKRYAWASAWGKEANAGTQGGSAVLSDTNILVNAATRRLASASWQTGDKALFQLFARSCSPHQMKNGVYDYTAYCEVSRSVLALKFNLRQLPVGKMTTANVYLRAYQPSLLAYDPGHPGGIFIDAAGLGNSSKILVSIQDELPEHPSSVADMSPMEIFELYGNSNNNHTYNVETATMDIMRYDPHDMYHTSHATDCMFLPTVYATDSTSPSSYYHDFQLTGGCGDALKSGGKGDIWLVTQFNNSNGIADNVYGRGLMPGRGLLMYVQRLELRFQLTKTKWNN